MRYNPGMKSPRKKKQKKLKTKAEIEAELASKQLQSKRFHQKVKESGKIYKRKEGKGEIIRQADDTLG